MYCDPAVCQGRRDQSTREDYVQWPDFVRDVVWQDTPEYRTSISDGDCIEGEICCDAARLLQSVCGKVEEWDV